MRDNDIGVTIRLTVKDDADQSVIDVSGASTKQILFVDPAGVKSTETAAFSTDGTNGQIEYVSTDGDFSVIGTWKAQAKIVTGLGTYRSKPARFAVHVALDS